MISVPTAGRLLDFGRDGRIGQEAADEQLRGAVAIHNILERHRVAYLADEVGMGKTYVALGAVALFRHFDPGFRLLVIAPRENIQKKWVKELRNFVARNVRFPDLRVKSLHGLPARPTVVCGSLAELVRETTHNPDRDFFARLTSFSLPLGRDAEGWKRKREELLRAIPSAPREALDLRDKEAFKDAYARVVCSALPEFDLVIVDEGHNLKHGFGEGVSARNRVLGLAFGHPEGAARGFRGYGPRARRVLFLSATPVENDFVQLWNQLHVFGLGASAPELADEAAAPEVKREAARRFLVRRVSEMTVGGRRLTKNLYRREWQNGGVDRHDEPLRVPGARQRLVVALHQKKVAEVLGDERLNNSFQIGMLASFESFLETAGVKPKDGADGEEANFDGADQVEKAEGRPDERLGVDVGAVNRLARSFRRQFGRELPHPKMDALVERLAEGFDGGRKALVFVRRIASVKELQRKLEEKYDAWLLGRLREGMGPELAPELEAAFGTYRGEQADWRLRRGEAPSGEGEPTVLDEDTDAAVGRPAEAEADTGGYDTFFAWFFRGRGRPGLLTGGAIRERLGDSPLFEENHVAALLGTRPGGVFERLAEATGMTPPGLRQELAARALPFLPGVRKQWRRRGLFLAFQRAAVSLLAEKEGPCRDRARVVLHERWPVPPRDLRGSLEPPEPAGWLEVRTFWTELRLREDLRRALWPEKTVPGGDAVAFEAGYREAELRRELLSAAARLGHAFLDLYVLVARRIGSLAPRARAEEGDEGDRELVGAFLDLLERQRREEPSRFHAFRELSEAAAHFDLLLDVNAHELRTAPLEEAAKVFGALLGSQAPIGGMWGTLNTRLVRQFRMPGYPLALVTTDLLQEGEDLHTFCSEVHHYGLSWMPSSLEQRIGRVDRVNSQTERRLRAIGRDPAGEELLQVHYPHLQDTYEVLQVQKVLERMRRFLVLMHEGLGAHEKEEPRVYVTREMVKFRRGLEPIQSPLQTAYPVPGWALGNEDRPLAVDEKSTGRLLERFQALKGRVASDIGWEEKCPPGMLRGSRLLKERTQYLELRVRSLEGRLLVHCQSPVGLAGDDFDWDSFAAEAAALPVFVLEVEDSSSERTELWAETDVLLAGEEHDATRVQGLIDRVTRAADSLEERFFRQDTPPEAYRERIGPELDEGGREIP